MSADYKLIALTIIVLLLSACGGYHSEHVYKLYPGPELPESDIATLKFGKGVYAVEIDGLKVSSADYERQQTALLTAAEP